MTTQKQAEQLIILMEEAAEVQQACAKIFRFGLHDQDNLEHLKKEIGDLFGIIEWIAKEFEWDPDDLIKLAIQKQAKMIEWTYHQDK